MKTQFRFAFNSSLVLGALLIGALPGNAQTTNFVTIDSSKSWLGYQVVYDTNNAEIGAENGSVPTADLRAYFRPDVVSATRLLLQMNTNKYNTAGPGNLADGTPNRIYLGNFYVEVPTAFGGTTVNFSGTVESNSLPTSENIVSNTYGVAFIKEFQPGYVFLGEEVAPLTPGAFNISRAITAGNIAQYGFYVKGPNAAPNSPNANQAVSLLAGNSNPPVSAVTVMVDSLQNWQGFLNYLHTSNNGYAGGFGTAPANLPAAFVPNPANASRLVIGINTNTYDATSSNWFGTFPINSFNDPDGTANKYLEPDLYVDVGTLYGGAVVTFKGIVESNALPAGEVAYGVIKEFGPGYDPFIGATTVVLPSSGQFTVSRPIGSGNISQYGLYIYGTNTPPGSPNSTKAVSIYPVLPVSASRSGNNVLIKFPGFTGTNYGVLYKALLTDANWLGLTNITGNGGVMTATDTIIAGGKRYYRVAF